LSPRIILNIKYNVFYIDQEKDWHPGQLSSCVAHISSWPASYESSKRLEFLPSFYYVHFFLHRTPAVMVFKFPGYVGYLQFQGNTFFVKKAR
jgi:hypothetical protein